MQNVRKHIFPEPFSSAIQERSLSSPDFDKPLARGWGGRKWGIYLGKSPSGHTSFMPTISQLPCNFNTFWSFLRSNFPLRLLFAPNLLRSLDSHNSYVKQNSMALTTPFLLLSLPPVFMGYRSTDGTAGTRPSVIKLARPKRQKTFAALRLLP
jgi:hypothetical protein